jgi:carbon starvation protein
VFVASFAATTLDSACRLQRYVIQELAVASGFKALSGKYTATLLAISIALLVAAIPLPGMSWSWQHAGSGGMILWPLFGATNQLLGGLAFLVILFWMKQKDMPIWFAVVPTVFMLILPGLAMTIELFQPGGWLSQHQWHLVGIGIATLALEIWMLVEAWLAWKRLRNLP